MITPFDKIACAEKHSKSNTLAFVILSKPCFFFGGFFSIHLDGKVAHEPRRPTRPELIPVFLA